MSDADRYSRGLAEQAPLYGNEIRDNLADLPEPFDTQLPRFLTEFCFGDFYTRGGLTLAQRELLVLCALATIGDTSAQLGPHGRACLQVGNSKAAVVAALVHCFPYIGFPRAVAAIRAVKDLLVMSDRPGERPVEVHDETGHHEDNPLHGAEAGTMQQTQQARAPKTQPFGAEAFGAE